MTSQTLDSGDEMSSEDPDIIDYQPCGALHGEGISELQYIDNVAAPDFLVVAKLLLPNSGGCTQV